MQIPSPRPSVGVFLPSFDGAPYVVTEIDPGFFHILLLPAEWSLLGQLGFAQIQAVRNKLHTFHVPQRGTCLAFDEGGWACPMFVMPSGGPTVYGKLEPCGPIVSTVEMRVREAALDYFCRRTRSEPTFSDELVSHGEAVASRLVPCEACGEWNGEHPLRSEERVVPVRCRCRNDTLCARCGRPLWERRLRAAYFDREAEVVRYVPGCRALSHCCPGERG